MEGHTESKSINVTSVDEDHNSNSNFELTKVFMNRNFHQCYFNNRGYCRFRDKCRYRHYKQICPKSICRDQECNYRHPRSCKYRELCKFYKKDICAFKHINIIKKETSENEIKSHFEEIQKLKNEILQLKTDVESKVKELNDLSAKLDNKET